MIVLSVDSSSLVTTVALLKDEYILGEYTLNFKREHSIILMKKIEMLLKDCEVDINEIDLSFLRALVHLQDLESEWLLLKV